MSHLSRRTLVKGAAWAAPAVAVSATVPAYAASPSQCGGVKFDSYIHIIDGVPGRTGQTAYAWFAFGTMEISIPEGRTVKSATAGFWMEKHSGNNDGSNRGFVSPSNPSMKYYSEVGGRRGPLANIAPNTTANFWHHRANLRRDTSSGIGPGYNFTYLGESAQTWDDGTTTTGWGMQTTWTSGLDNRASDANYSAPAGGCKTFTIPNMGGIQWVTQNIYTPVNRQMNAWRYIRIILDDGSVIEGRDSRTWSQDPATIRTFG